MTTAVNMAERLLGKPGTARGARREEGKPEGAGEFASVLQNVAQAKDAKETRATVAAAARPARRGEKAEKGREKNKNKGPDEAAVATDGATTQDASDGAPPEAEATDDAVDVAAEASDVDTGDETKEPTSLTGAEASTQVLQGLPVPGSRLPAAGDGAIPEDATPRPTGTEAGPLTGEAQPKDGKREHRRLEEGRTDGKPAATANGPVIRNEAKPAQRSEDTGAASGDAAVQKLPSPAERPTTKGSGRQSEGEGRGKQSGEPQTQVPNAELQAAAPTEVDVSSMASPRLAAVKDETPRPSPTPMMSSTMETKFEGTMGSAGSAAQAQESPRTGDEQAFDQIVLGLRTKLDANNQKAQIELNPPNLGRLQVSVEVANGQLTAQFHATTDVVRDLLRSNMDRLRSVLEGQGITVDKLAVSSGTPQDRVMSADSSGLANQSHDGRSGGSFAQERQPAGRNGGETFGRIWKEIRSKEEPIDVLA